MKLNPLNQALLQRAVARPNLLLNLKEVEFIAKDVALTPKEVAPHFEHTKDLPYLKLKPQKRKGPLSQSCWSRFFRWSSSWWTQCDMGAL